MLIRGEDDYTRELECDRGCALWRAELSSGQVVIMDDGRPGVQPASAWLRLAAYLQEQRLRIVRFWLQFRDQVCQPLPDNADGYYFAKGTVGILNAGCCFNFMLLGHLHNGRLMVQRWHVPELILVSQEERDPHLAGDCLIRNPSCPPIGLSDPSTLIFC